MSCRTPLDLRAELACIEEGARRRAENRKLLAESRKLDAEQARSLPERLKPGRQRWFAPALAMTALIGGLLGTASFIAHLVGH